MPFQLSEISVILPEITILLVAILVLLYELLVTRNDTVLQLITVIGLLVAMAMTVINGTTTASMFGMVSGDGVAMFFNILLIGVALLAVLMSRDYLHGSNMRHGEFYALLLLVTCGMMALASATDLIMLFLGIETMSIGLYVLAGSHSERPRSGEAALKYFLLGAFASGFLLYGMALIFGASGGQTNFERIAEALSIMSGTKPIHLYVGVGLVMVGLLFKVAAVPFHFWSPDVYHGSPTPVTAFMSAGPKAAAFAVFIRLFGDALPAVSSVWVPSLWMVSVLTMTVGNIIAISQVNLKRMLAYSSIAHAGYLLIAIIASGNPLANSEATAGLMFYLTAYYLMNLGAFTIAIIIQKTNQDKDYDIAEYHGLAGRNPWLAASMAIFMVSLAGIPPMAGFFGKLAVFSAGIKAGYVTLVVIAVLNSVVSVYYYLRIVVFMYMKPTTETLAIRVSPAMAVILIVCVLGILKFGIMPGDLMKWTRQSADQIQVTSTHIISPVPITSSTVHGK